MKKILILGNNGCINCESVKAFADRTGLQYTYIKAEEIEKDIKDEYLKKAKAQRIFSFPIIFINDEVITVQQFKNMFTKYVIKRDGRRAEFDKERIVNAVLAAMKAANEIDEPVAEKIAGEIYKSTDKQCTIEEIQDSVQTLLLRNEKENTAIKYIAYRTERMLNRSTPKASRYELLDDDFISKYKHKPDPMAQVVGAFTYYRTYSRWLPEVKRRERWYETVRRAVEYNCKLAHTSKKEAQRLFDTIYNLKGFLSGRTFWVANTPVSYKYPTSNYNCAFEVVDKLDAFVDMFLLLMLGAGFGFRILPEDVQNLPKVRKDINIIHKFYEGTPKKDREDITSFIVNGNTVTIKVGDSKEGWSQALKHYLTLISDTSYRFIKTIIFDYDFVRPLGERLKTFGGRASGYESLKTMFTKMDRVIKKIGSEDQSVVKLRPIDCLDIANIIGENVVSGGVRRTSEICVFSPDDTEVLNSKKDLYTCIDGQWIEDKEISHRRMSNNSIYYEAKPTRQKLHEQLVSIRYNGEPGFINAEAAKKRRPNFNGLNPCAEILLDSAGLCNLVTNNVAAFVKDGQLDKKGLLETIRLTARASYRMTIPELELHEWDRVQKRDRLLGVSLTGWQDMVDMLNLNREGQAALLSELKAAAKSAAEEIASNLGLNPPLLVTTVKPEGTISLLPTVSSGVHYSHSPYYIRRIRISAFDPLVKVCEELGYPVVPETGQTLEDCKTKVIEFPVKCGATKTKFDVSALEQLENYRMFMENYVDHNCSITISVRDHEWEETEQWIWDNWDEVVGISLLPLSDASYPLMPYESITEEEYNRRASEIQPFNPELISKYETQEDFDISSDEECTTGACAVR